MHFNIRLCQLADCQAICKLSSSEMGYDYPEDKTINKLKMLLKSEKDRIFVATTHEEVIGYVHASDYDVIYAPHMKNIMGIAVSSAYKKNGIGKALLAAVEEWGKETGACGIRLVSGATRTAAHEFYRHCGYDGGKQQINFKKIFSYGK